MTAHRQESARPPYLAIAVGAYIASRILLHLIGVRFDASPLAYYHQYLDPDLLRFDLVRSIVYLHTQPPLFNLFLGVILKVFPHHAALAFAISYKLLGVAMVVSLFLLMHAMGLTGRTSLILTTLFFISPSCVLFENSLVYTYPTMALLCVAAVVLHKAVAARSFVMLFLAFSLCAIIVLTRSLFNLVWLLAVVAMLVAFRPGDRLKLVAASCVPLAAVLLWYGKNVHLFGTFGASSWLGYGLYKMTVLGLPLEERLDLIRQGRLSPISLVPLYRPVDEYRPFLRPIAPTGVPALDQELKSNGRPNLNHVAYVAVANRYRVDALTALRLRPDAYARSVFDSVILSFLPASEFWPTYPETPRNANRILMFPYEVVYNAILYGSISSSSRQAPASSVGIFLVLAYLGAALWGGFLCAETLTAVFRQWRSVAANNADDCLETSSPAARVTLLFLWITLLYVLIVSNALEIGETMRMRYLVEPFVLVVVASGVRELKARCGR